MALYRLENEDVVVEVDEYASEIHHFYAKDTGIEYMWQGNPTYWVGRNPTLFPMVGVTCDGILHIDGMEYKTTQHGFARRSMFQCVKQGKDLLRFELKDNKETQKEYPFSFLLGIEYHLKGKCLTIQYDIHNTNERDMPFHFGLHPAFNCPLIEGEDFFDYELVFSDEEKNSPVSLKEGRRMELNREALLDTIIFDHPTSEEVCLTNGKHGVKVAFKHYPWLAFWSKNAPFVCI